MGGPEEAENNTSQSSSTASGYASLTAVRCGWPPASPHSRKAARSRAALSSACLTRSSARATAASSSAVSRSAEEDGPGVLGLDCASAARSRSAALSKQSPVASGLRPLSRRHERRVQTSHKAGRKIAVRSSGNSTSRAVAAAPAPPVAGIDGRGSGGGGGGGAPKMAAGVDCRAHCDGGGLGGRTKPSTSRVCDLMCSCEASCIACSCGCKGAVKNRGTRVEAILSHSIDSFFKVVDDGISDPAPRLNLLP